MIGLSKSLVIAAFILVSMINLTSCSSTSVYGSVGLGVGSGGFNHHGGSGRRMHGSISVGGRIR